MSENWPRYVFASIADYLKTVAQGESLLALVEGLDERTDAFMQATDRAEIRITGPVVREPAHASYILYVDVSVLLVSRYQDNAYNLLIYAGAFYDALRTVIPVWNYGNLPGDYGDNPIQLGCLTLRPGSAVDVIHRGQVDPVQKIRMSEVNAKFMMEISE